MITDIPEELLWIILSVVVAAYALGVYVTKKKERKRRGIACQQLYQEALNCHNGSLPIQALMIASHALGEMDRHECYNIIGATLDQMKDFSESSTYWRHARVAARQQDPDSQVYYYYREVRSFMRDSNYEFAHLRSKNAIALIASVSIPLPRDAVTYYHHLRAFHMISALNHLHGMQAWETARVDAQWLQANAEDLSLKDLASSIARADGARQTITEAMMQGLYADSAKGAYDV
jgi:hypothetical protein